MKEEWVLSGPCSDWERVGLAKSRWVKWSTSRCKIREGYLYSVTREERSPKTGEVRVSVGTTFVPCEHPPPAPAGPTMPDGWSPELKSEPKPKAPKPKPKAQTKTAPPSSPKEKGGIFRRGKKKKG